MDELNDQALRDAIRASTRAVNLVHAVVGDRLSCAWESKSAQKYSEELKARAASRKRGEQGAVPGGQTKAARVEIDEELISVLPPNDHRQSGNGERMKKNLGGQQQSTKRRKSERGPNLTDSVNHCESKILAAINTNRADIYARFKYVTALAANIDTDTLFDDEDVPGTADENDNLSSIRQIRIRGSKYRRPFPPESILHKQVIILGNGEKQQYIGDPAEYSRSPSVKRFAEVQREVKLANATYTADNNLVGDRQYLPQVPPTLGRTMAEVLLETAID
eukprot:2460520-Amphidinium_carterae.4